MPPDWAGWCEDQFATVFDLRALRGTVSVLEVARQQAEGLEGSYARADSPMENADDCRPALIGAAHI